MYSVETRIWSETTLFLTATAERSHGDYLDAARYGNVPEVAQPLTTLIRPILEALQRTGHQ